MSAKGGTAILFAITLLAITGSLWAQGPDSLWHRAFGDSLSDWCFSVIETHDGYYVAAGPLQVYNPDSAKVFSDVYVLKLDTAGDTLWARTYGGVRSDGAHSVIEASDGNYVIAGHTDSWGMVDHDIYVLKIDTEGDPVWERTIGDSRGDEESFCVREAPDSTYRIVGTSDAFGTVDILLAGIGADGSGSWYTTYQMPGYQSGQELEFTPDGKLVIVGADIGATADVYLMKTESNGDTIWTRTYDFGPLDYGMSIKTAGDRAYIVTGYSESPLAPFFNAFLLHLGTDGSENWSRFYGGSDHDHSYSVQVLDDGGFVFAGHTESYGVGGNDVWLVRTDAIGDTVWTKTYGGPGTDIGWEVQATSDGGFIIGGQSNSFGNGFIDLYVVKTEGDQAWVLPRDEGPDALSLSVMPNPSRGSVAVSFKSPNPGREELLVCDLLGRSLRELKPLSRASGTTTVVWDGCDTQGKRVVPGIYFLHLKAGVASATHKVIVLR